MIAQVLDRRPRERADGHHDHDRNKCGHRDDGHDIAESYDHKHQPLSAESDDGGLSKMSIDICKALFRKLAINGVVLSQETFRTIKASYFRVALDFVESYHNDAIINGLHLDIHREEQAVELFASNIMKAGEQFLENPMDTPFIPSWSRVQSARPDIFDRIHAAVEEDHREFGGG